MASTPAPTVSTSHTLRGDLRPSEYFWRDHQQWLESLGYTLSSRYKPNWIPSWQGTNKKYYHCDDGLAPDYSHVLDAVRVSDGKMVTLKQLSTKDHPNEVEISQMFSSPELAADPRNHCVPVYDVLTPPDPDIMLLVLPLLRKYNDPPLITVGEVVEFLHQVFQGLQFMHQHHVAHRDCMNLNIMMDPSAIYPDMYHPRSPYRNRNLKGEAKYFTRTERPTKYYLIDFGLAVKFDADDTNPTALPIRGGDKTVPEFQDDETYDKEQNPFPTDIYYLGNMVREDFLQTYPILEFLTPLVTDMVQDDPAGRPTIDEVVDRFVKLRSKLPFWKLRARLVDPEETGMIKFLKNVIHVFRTANFIFRRYSAIPTPVS
ncbi:kinase-like domain-containing protein [Amylocystis lapponica]|nr:kinase-like domain-containing protein [Amylocystis lapponica]